MVYGGAVLTVHCVVELEVKSCPGRFLFGSEVVFSCPPATAWNTVECDVCMY